MSFQGMHKHTGANLTGIEHLRQSIQDILTTPLGSRVFRRDYGSALFDLIDMPSNEAWYVEIYAATTDALAKWEPRFLLKKVSAYRQGPGKIVLDVEGEILHEGQQVRFDGIQVSQ